MATRQSTLDFPIRKKSSRCLPASKYLSEKENNVSSPSRRLSSRIKQKPSVGYALSEIESEPGSDSEESNINSTPSKVSTPSKRRTTQNTQGFSSPPKISCSASRGDELTPSTRLSGLTLKTPDSKPARRAPLSPEKLPPKELFPEGTDTTANSFRKARLAFHTSCTENLPGREKELAELKDFLMNHINSGTSGSLYISGPPGTGKTACLFYLMNRDEIKGCFQTVYINCTSMKSPGALYSHVISQLKLKIRGRPTEKTCLAAIEKYLSSKRNMVLFVLDELDQLESRDQSVLYTVFEWPIVHTEGLVLVGIANALDLTDRTLPRLRARLDLAPKLLHFAPYSKDQLINILKFRLEEAGVGDVFSAPALQMLASKVATVSGDVRRALDIGRRVIEMTGNPFHDSPQPVAVKCAHILTPSENRMPAPSPRKISEINSPRKINSRVNGEMSPLKSISSPSKLRSIVQNSPPKLMLSPRKLLLSPTRNATPVSLVKTESPKKTASARKLFQSPTKSIPKQTPTVDLKGVMTVVGEVYGTSQSGGHGAEELPLQQRIAVCSLLLVLRNSKSKDVTVGKLHDVYRRVCNKRRFDPLDHAAFLSMLSLIEARGLLRIQGKGKPSRLSKICLQWVEDEVVAALRDRELLSSILNDVACLG